MLKKLLFVGAIIAVMPLEREKQADLFMAAKSTVADISGFCDRNPQVCLKGHAAIDKLASKAEFSAKMVLDIAREPTDGKPDQLAQLLKATAPLPATSPGIPFPVASNERFPAYKNNQYNELYKANDPVLPKAKDDQVLPFNTLSANDLKPGWQGASLQ